MSAAEAAAPGTAAHEKRSVMVTIVAARGARGGLGAERYGLRDVDIDGSSQDSPLNPMWMVRERERKRECATRVDLRDLDRGRPAEPIARCSR